MNDGWVADLVGTFTHFPRVPRAHEKTQNKAIRRM